eukprot:TRINITY_DN9540_c0_g1_i1.p1 TRINITY_DN9540_c0_g1~~TRINITY_DN9540_c0_g1_i1.p1  ORF type:complete len:769 (+),score=148.83 TRINITY_DN9540_c0_g1_i1:39-2345(+)
MAAIHLPDLRPCPPTTSNARNNKPRRTQATVSSWPASVTSSMQRSPSGSTSLSGFSPVRAKPCLAREMETFIARELNRIRGEDEPENPTTRLQVFREVFRWFISQFKDYSQVLSSIMQEYDRALEALQLQLRLVTASQSDTSANVTQNTSIVEVECARLRETNGALTKRCEALEAEARDARMDRQRRDAEAAGLQAELAKRDAEVKEEYQRNVFLSAALREQAERQRRDYEQIRNLEMESTNQKSLALVLGEQLHAALRENTADELTAGKPTQDDIARLEQGVLEAKEETEELKRRMKKLLAQNFQLATELKQTRTKFERYRQAVQQESGRALTPRPEWREVFAGEDINWPVAPDGSDRPMPSQEMLTAIKSSWDQLRAEHKKTAQMAQKANVIQNFMEDEAIQDLQLDVLKRPRFFIGLGTGESVPQYLRWHGKVPYTDIQKGECERIVKEIWAEKTKPAKKGQENFQNMPMATFLYYYLLRQAGGSHQKAVTLGYNLTEALNKFKFDADIDMFLKVLRGEVPEAVYGDQHKMLQSVKLMFAKLDPDNKGRVQRQAVKNALVKLFPAKSHEDMLRVRYHLMMEQPTPWINYRLLFEEDEDGNQGEFVECLRDQHLHEIREYMVDVEQLLRNAADANSEIDLLTAKQEIQQDDLDKPESEINEYIARAVGLTRVSQVNWDEKRDVSELISGMKTGLMKRTSRKPQKKLIPTLNSRSQNDDDALEGNIPGSTSPARSPLPPDAMPGLMDNEPGVLEGVTSPARSPLPGD